MLQRKSCLQQKMSQLDRGIYQGLADCKHAHVGTSLNAEILAIKQTAQCAHIEILNTALFVPAPLI